MNYLLKFKNILAIVGVGVVFVVINLSTYSGHNSQLEKLDSELKKIEEGKEAITRWNKIRRDYRGLEDVFLIEGTMPFKQFVRLKARQFDIKINSLKSSFVEKGDYLELPMEVAVTCSYDNFLAFVEALEEKTVEIKRATIKRQKNEQEIKAELYLVGLVVNNL